MRDVVVHFGVHCLGRFRFFGEQFAQFAEQFPERVRRLVAQMLFLGIAR